MFLGLYNCSRFLKAEVNPSINKFNIWQSDVSVQWKKTSLNQDRKSKSHKKEQIWDYIEMKNFPVAKKKDKRQIFLNVWNFIAVDIFKNYYILRKSLHEHR